MKLVEVEVWVAILPAIHHHHHSSTPNNIRQPILLINRALAMVGVVRVTIRFRHHHDRWVVEEFLVWVDIPQVTTLPLFDVS